MKICVHTFYMGDVEDPEIYAGEPLYQWEKSEKGQWVMNHSIDQPYYNIIPDPNTFGYRCTIFADLLDADLTYFKLKWA